MREIKIKNLVNFWFLTRYSNLENTSPDYLLEKWSKYIGVQKFKNNLEFKTRGNMVSIIMTIGEDDMFNLESLEKWKRRWYIKNDDELLINIYLFTTINKSKIDWTLSEIIEIFEKNVAKIDDINGSEYVNLHKVISNIVDEWFLVPVNNRDFKLEILNI